MIPPDLRAEAGGMPDKVTLQLAWKHQFQFAGYYAALAKGYYREEGLEVTIRECRRGVFARESLLSGQAQYGVAGSELILHRAEGDPFVVLAPIFQHSPSILVTRKDSGIETPHDLIGKRVMILPGKKDADILAVLKNENIGMNSIKRLDQSFDLNDLIDGRTDAFSAYLTNEPWYLESIGITPGIIKPLSYGVDFYGDCLFTTDREVEKHPERVNRFLKASLRGWEYAMAHHEEMIDIILARYGVKKERVHLRFEADAIQKCMLPDLVRIGHMNPGRWRHIADTYVELGMLEPDYSMKGFLYDPDPAAGYRWMNWAFYILVVVSLLIGLIAALLFIFNKKLKKEISERKQAEEALKESEARFRALFENVPAAIQGYSPDGTICYWNRASEDLYGYTREEAVGNNIIDLIVPPELHEHVLNTIRRAVETGIAAPSEELMVMRNDGSPVSVLTSYVVLKKNRKVPEFYCMDVDLTQRKQLQNRLEQARKAEAISCLAGGIAHQFNNVLSGITGNVDLLEMIYPGEENLLRHTGRMKKAALRMADLTSQLVAYAKGGKYQPDTISVHDFVSRTLPLIKHAVDPAVKVEVDLPVDSGSIKADKAQMQMVLMALLSNASEAMEGRDNGQIRITGKSGMLTSADAEGFPGLKPGNYMKLSVGDNGKGMDEMTRKRIFEPFFTTRFLGRGLGMAAVYGIIKNHEGWIFIESEPDKGTTVKIYLPAVENIVKKHVVPKPAPVKGSGTILIIEDDKMVMDVNRALLTKLGYDVLEAKTGQEAVDMAGTFEGNIDMALLDIVLPDMDGKAIYPLLMDARPDLKVIVCSEYSIDGPTSEILDAGAEDFIQKPFERADLMEKLKKISD